MKDPLVGQILSERYEILEVIGEGGMGRIYKARQEPIGRLVAVKVLHAEAIDNERTVTRFLTEAKIIARLKHPNTVRLIDFGHVPGGAFFIVMEYLEDGSLRALIDAGRLPPRKALSIARQICCSLAEAHHLGVIHRDLKPANVMLEAIYGEDIMARVLDFGLAKIAPGEADGETPAGFSAAELTLPGSRIGSPTYMSPEQAFAKPLDGRADLYAVGVLIYEMLTGKPPFAAENTTGLCLAHLHDAAPDFAIQHGLDPQVEVLVHRLLSKDRNDRPADAAAVIKAIDAILALSKLDTPVFLTPPPERTTEPMRTVAASEATPPGLTGKAAFAILGIALGFGIAFVLLRNS